MTGVWALLLDRPLSAQEAAELTALLPPERRERLHRMRLPEKRQEVLCAYLILRRALREQYRWQEIPPIVCEDDGKPFFPDAPQVQFNLSHTAGAVLAALSDRPVGVDIERIRPLSPLARRRLAEGTSQEAFFADWVRRGPWVSGWAPEYGPMGRRRCVRRIAGFSRWRRSQGMPPGSVSAPGRRRWRSTGTTLRSSFEKMGTGNGR